MEKISEVMETSQEVLDELEDKLNEIYRLAYNNRIPLFVLYEPTVQDKMVLMHKILTTQDLSMTLEDDRITRYAASLDKDIGLVFKNDKVTTRETLLNDALNDIIDEDL